MLTRSKLLLAGLTAMLVLATAVSTASANRLAASDNDFLAIFPELTFSGGGSTIICGVTLLGSFHNQTITKSIGSEIGQIYDADVDACQGDGNATILEETLPWGLTYHGFFEELPEIEGINLRLIGAAFEVEDGVACLAATETNEPAGGEALLNAEGQVTSLVADPNFAIDLEDERFLCALAGDSNFAGSASVTDKDGQPLTITLV